MRVKSLLSVLFAQSIIWKMREANPCSGVAGNREHNRERYLSTEEIVRLIAVLDRWQEQRKHVDSVDAIRLAILTGARRGEIVGMRWADVNLDAAVWAKPATSTKQRKAHRIPLSSEAVAVLLRPWGEREASGKVVHLRDDHVFRGGGSKTHTNTLEKYWYVIRAAAGLEDLRFHDLRHSFASLLVGQGFSLPIIGAMLGHSKPQTTARYSHLADQPLREAAGVIGNIVGRRAP
jgi:integrase